MHDGSNRPVWSLERLANRRAEGGLAARIDRAFEVDPIAVARVRSRLLSNSPTTLAPQGRVGRTWMPRLGLMPAAIALVLAIALGAIVAGGLHPGGPSHPGVGAIETTLPSASAIDTLGQSTSDLAAVLTTARTGDAAATAIGLRTYQADLTVIAADLQLPGADLVAAGGRLRAQEQELATIPDTLSSANEAVIVEIRGDLDQIIASLPVASTPGPATHGNAGGNGSGNGAGGTGKSNAGGNGKGHPKAR